MNAGRNGSAAAEPFLSEFMADYNARLAKPAGREFGGAQLLALVAQEMGDVLQALRIFQPDLRASNAIVQTSPSRRNTAGNASGDRETALHRDGWTTRAEEVARELA